MTDDPTSAPSPVEQPTLLADWPADPELDPYGSRMLPELGLGMRAMGWLFFRRIDDQSCDLEPVRSAAGEGSLVYVMRTRSLLDYLYFNYFVLKKRLPLARFANGVRTTLFGPAGKTLRALWTKIAWRRAHERRFPDPVESGYISSMAHGGQPFLVFLRRGRGGLLAPQEASRDLVEVLVEVQQQREEPIFVVPQILVWERQPDRTTRGLLDVIAGDQDNPGFIRKTMIFLLWHRRAVVRVGEPVNLKEFIETQAGQSTARIAKKLRWLLLGYLFRERRVVKGPDVRPRRWIFDRILAEPAVRNAIAETARRDGRGVTAVEKRARKILDKTGADLRWGVIMTLRILVDIVNSRIYSGVEFDPEDAERIRAAARKGTVLLLPSHRSHFDYLLLSWLLFYQGMMPPHIAAGQNLSFFPMGMIFRRSGAFFLRRSFGGDILYSTLLNHYVRALTSEGYTQEFFIEGGRSRTGKMLPPKIGLLGTYVEAMADKIVPDIQIVPIYIAYERVVEDYSEELAGVEKKRETAGELVKASSVLRKRFGRVYVKTNNPISLKESIETLDSPWRDMSTEAHRAWLKRFGRHLVAEIQDVTVVTPSSVAATALLTHDRRGTTRERFHRTCRFLRRWLESRDAPFSDAWQFPEDALDETLELFASANLVEILVEPKSEDSDGGDDIIAIASDAGPRMQMDYSKNGVLFHFVPAAFLCTVLALGEGGRRALSRVQFGFDFLMDLFGEEFFFHPDMPTSFLLRDAGRHLQEHGIIRARQLDAPSVDVDSSAPDPGPWLDELHEDDEVILEMVDRPKAALLIATVRNFCEAYYVVLKGSRVLREGPMTEKELVASVMSVGRRMYLTEDVTRPEAIGKVNITNAVRHFADKGVLLPLGNSPRGRDTRLVLDEDARGRYMGQMKVLFFSRQLRPAPRFQR